MASCIQTNVHRPSLFIPKVSQSRCQNDAPLCVLPLPRVNGSSMKSLKYPQNGLMQQQFATLLKHQKSEPVVKYRNGSAVCLLGGEDKSEKDSQVPGLLFKFLFGVRYCLHIFFSDISEILIL